MTKLFTACGSILGLLLCLSVLLAFKFPAHAAVGLTLFAGCLAGVLGLAARLALEDRRR
jgi:hypothetical protein